MIKKIISGGQTGADRAALDTAIKFNIDHGGWVPKGRRAEDGILPDKYRLKEMPTDSYPRRTEKNIWDSHATLIVVHGDLTSGSLLTKRLAQKLERPCCHINLLDIDEFEAAIVVHAFITDYRVEVLNVAGPRASHDPDIYRSVRGLMEILVYMLIMETTPHELKSEDFLLYSHQTGKLPQTLDQALDCLAEELHLRTRCQIANLDESAIASSYFFMTDYMKMKLGLDAGNKSLFEDCRMLADEAILDIDDAVMMILKHLQLRLKKEHVLRIMK